MTHKLTQGLVDRLVELIEESEDIFLAERKFLLDKKAPLKITVDERREQNEQEIKETAEVLGQELAKKVSVKAPEPVQEGISGMD